MRWARGDIRLFGLLCLLEWTPLSAQQGEMPIVHTTVVVTHGIDGQGTASTQANWEISCENADDETDVVTLSGGVPYEGTLVSRARAECKLRMYDPIPLSGYNWTGFGRDVLLFPGYEDTLETFEVCTILCCHNEANGGTGDEDGVVCRCRPKVMPTEGCLEPLTPSNDSAAAQTTCDTTQEYGLCS